MRLPAVSRYLLSLPALLHVTILIGATLRIVSAGLISIGFDGGYYIVMGASFA